MNGPLAALNSVTDGVLTVDLDSCIVYMNPAAEQLTGWLLHEAVGQPSSDVFKIVNSVTRETEWQPVRAAIQDDDAYSLLPHSLLLRRDGNETPVEDSVCPIHDANGQVSGAAIIFRDVGHTRLLLLKALHRANHDPLTTLPNRTVLKERMKRAFLGRQERASAAAALLYIDVDHFKHINDSLGHVVGDYVIQVVAKRLAACLRRSDVVCRVGGDEFIAFVPELQDTATLERVVDSLLGSVREPFRVEGTTLKVTISIGVAIIYHDEEATDSFIQDADSAMYAVKRTGGNGARWFSSEMRSVPRTQTDFEAGLQTALDRKEFRVHYQPQIELRTGRIIGAEALLRWQISDSTILSPLSFIQIAERNGLIVPIGQLVLRSVLHQQRIWREQGGPRLRISVNVSPRELLHPEYLATFDAILAEGDYHPGSLLLELTESESLHSDQQRDLLSAFKRRGLDLGIDDFGVGYSNLDYLRRFPVDVIKIDRDFLRNVGTSQQDAILLKAMIRMARSLKRVVIAEGVETQEQVDLLKTSSCDQAQGFFFSPGVTPEAFAALLVDQKTGRGFLPLPLLAQASHPKPASASFG